MKMLYSILLCAILSAVAVEAQKQRVLLEYPFYVDSGKVPETHLFIEELVEEFGEDRLVVFNYSINHGLWEEIDILSPELYYRKGAPISDFEFGAVNRRTDHDPLNPVKGIHRQAWRQNIRTILEEEPVVEVIPTKMEFLLTFEKGLQAAAEIQVVWHKPDGNVRLEFVLLQDSARVSQRNDFDTVVGHPFFGRGNPIENYNVHNYVLATENLGFGSIQPERIISYAGQDTMRLRYTVDWGFFMPEIMRLTTDRRLYKLLVIASKHNVVRRIGDDKRQWQHDIPVLNVGVLHGRDFTFLDEETSVSEETPPAGERIPLRVYPNPASTWLTVEHQAALEGGELEVIDMMGRTVVASPTGSGSTSKLRVSHLPEGMYTVLLRHQGRVQAGKVMVRK